MRTTLTALDVLAFDLVIGTLTRAGRAFVFARALVRSYVHADNIARDTAGWESGS
jgi:hypothetical protein